MFAISSIFTYIFLFNKLRNIKTFIFIVIIQYFTTKEIIYLVNNKLKAFRILKILRRDKTINISKRFGL